MKSLFCGICSSLHSLPGDASWVTCDCGACQARWQDPVRGTVLCRATDREKLRIIGMHNGFLRLAFSTPNGPSHRDWALLHRSVCQQANGYVFHSNVRDCWAAILRVGESNDTFWDETPEPQPVTSDIPDKIAAAIEVPKGRGRPRKAKAVGPAE